jgi:hypothetical protein
MVQTQCMYCARRAQSLMVFLNVTYYVSMCPDHVGFLCLLGSCLGLAAAANDAELKGKGTTPNVKIEKHIDSARRVPLSVGLWSHRWALLMWG